MAIVSWAGGNSSDMVLAYREIPGNGIEGIVNGDLITMGSAAFVMQKENDQSDSAVVYLAIEEKLIGKFKFRNHYRTEIPALLGLLNKQYQLAVVSGDNTSEKAYLRNLLGVKALLLFNQQPADKLKVIEHLQAQGKKVIMIGDGLNDAGALMQADTGIAVSENSNHFTPASDAILAADELPKLYRFIQLCKANKLVVLTAFVISIIYNVIGIFFAVQGSLSPMIAAILMPCSSISILLITFGMSNFFSRRLHLK